MLVPALCTIAIAVGMVLGFLTPIVSVLLALISAGLTLMPGTDQRFFVASLAGVEVIVIAVAIALLGPGAFSVDARLFGRREITIPHVSRTAKL